MRCALLAAAPLAWMSLPAHSAECEPWGQGESLHRLPPQYCLSCFCRCFSLCPPACCSCCLSTSSCRCVELLGPPYICISAARPSYACSALSLLPPLPGYLPLPANLISNHILNYCMQVLVVTPQGECMHTQCLYALKARTLWNQSHLDLHDVSIQAHVVAVP